MEKNEKAKAEAMAALEQIAEAGTTAVDDLLDDLRIGQIKLLLDSLARASFTDGSYDVWACIQLYEDAGMPDGDSFAALVRWVANVDNLHRKALQVTADEKDLREAGREQEEAAEREADKAADAAADRAADEGMFDREEEQMIRAEEERMDADPDDSVDK
ncbi:MAG: hypothetical protein ACLQUY_25290 [Ktedonobacterales bacterium]